MALTAVAVRLIIVAAVMVVFHKPALRDPFWFASWGDGPDYIAQAKGMRGDQNVMNDKDWNWHRRVFPGFAVLIAVGHLAGIGFEQAAMIIPWIASGIAAALGALVFRDRRIGWALVFLIPHYLSYSSMPMSESSLLVFTLGGILAVRNGWALPGGLMLGFAGVIRPVACFAAIGAMVYELIRGRRGGAIKVALGSGAVVAIALALLQLWSGDAFHGMQVYASNNKTAYEGEIFSWPFHSLIFTPFRKDLPFLKTGKIVYVWIHVALVLTACALLIGRCRKWRAADALDRLCLVWLIGNTMFELCVGSKWGFLHFARFAAPSMPAAFWAFRGILPRRWWIWGAIAAPSMIIAIDSVNRMN